jgi:hypothetical protein
LDDLLDSFDRNTGAHLAKKDTGAKEGQARTILFAKQLVTLI